MKKTISGFTIVELLIVVVVIAILATITVVAYNGIQNQSADAVIRSDLSNIAKKLETAKVELGHYPESAAEMPDYSLSKAAYDKDANNAYYCLDKPNQKYAFGARSKSKKGFILTNSGVIENTTVAGEYTCNAIGLSWVSDPNQFQVQGYYSASYASTDGWSPHWKWSK